MKTIRLKEATSIGLIPLPMKTGSFVEAVDYLYSEDVRNNLFINCQKMQGNG